MWGNIILEVSFINNFHLGFNNTRSDILIHLVQWQYWWWFWFSYWWGLYFLLFIRIFRFRVLKFKPRLATTYRPHGKWGDLLICLIPVSWCINIISNSNFILRMLEWQAESSLFTLRIRGRQWYWVYKYDLKTITDLITVPKNVGHNRWQITTPNDLQTSDDYLHIFQLRMHNKWIKRYWKEFLEKNLKETNFNILISNEITKKQVSGLVFKKNSLLVKDIYYNQESDFFLNIFKKNFFKIKINKFYYKENNIFNSILFDFSKYNYNFFKKQFLNTIGFYNDGTQDMSYIHNFDNNIDITRWTKRSQGTISPCRLIKYPITTTYVDKGINMKHFLFRFRFNEEASKLIHKPVSHNNFLVIKQKRYKPLKSVPMRVKNIRDETTGKNTKVIKYSGKLMLNDNTIFIEDSLNPTLKYKFLKKYKKQTETTPIVLWKRLLRTKRTLVLPAHVNITAVTNSYDVIHSWFIPGLGLKLDCVPGRATHHVLHIDNVGFYYGQCAEICGRYHHHMPIRVCALPFEHFLIWWYTFGLPKLMYVGTDQRCFTKDYALRKYIW